MHVGPSRLFPCVLPRIPSSPALPAARRTISRSYPCLVRNCARNPLSSFERPVAPSAVALIGQHASRPVPFVGQMDIPTVLEVLPETGACLQGGARVVDPAPRISQPYPS